MDKSRPHVTFSLILTDLEVDVSSLHTRSPFCLLLLIDRYIFNFLYHKTTKEHLPLYIIFFRGNVKKVHTITQSEANWQQVVALASVREIFEIFGFPDHG